MRRFDPGFAAHLASGVTTLAWCWRITRRDGVSMGFTDHDRTIHFDGIAFEPASGFTASEMESGLGLSVDGLEVEGALSSDRVRDADLSRGLYDGAEVRVFRVNWAKPEERALMRVGALGEVTRRDGAFTAEIRGLSHLLQQRQGRVYQRGCDAALGDARCGVNLDRAEFRSTGQVVRATSQASFTAAGLGAYAADWFRGGTLVWAGDASRRVFRVRTHRPLPDGAVEIALFEAPESIAAGDGFTITVGCAKRFSTCKRRFANAANFRGFPHMPGDAFVVAHPRQGDPENDGRGRFFGRD